MIRYLLVCALGLPAIIGLLWLAFAWGAMNGAMNEGEVRKAIAAYVRENPEEIINSLESYARRRQAVQDASTAAVAEAEKGALLSTDGIPGGGNLDGSIYLVYFFDYNCGYCRRMHPILEGIVEDNPDLRIIYRDLPILGPDSVAAARVGIALWKMMPTSFDDYLSAMKKHPGVHNKHSVLRILSEVVGKETASEVIAFSKADDAISDILRRNADLATRMNIAGTPFIYLDGHPFRGAVNAETLQAAIDAVRADHVNAGMSVAEPKEP